VSAPAVVDTPQLALALQPRVHKVAHVIQRENQTRHAEVAVVLVDSARTEMGIADLIDVQPVT